MLKKVLAMGLLLVGCGNPAPPVVAPTATFVPSASATPRANVEWRPYKAPDASFEVSLPGKPEVHDKDGHMVVASTLGDADHILCIVRSKDKTGIKSLKELNGTVIDAFVRSREADGSRVTRQETLTVQGRPALRLVVAKPGQRICDMVTVFTEDYRYQVTTIRPESSPFTPEAESKFSQSFKILKKSR